MKALVTGAAGFIASHLAERLVHQGADVVGLDCFTDFYPRARKEWNLARLAGHDRFRLVESSIADADLEALLDGVTHVFHLAAQAGGRESWGRHFRVYTINNVEATQTRDFTFVADAVTATVSAATRGKPGAVYNIGGGSRVALLDVFELIRRVTGRPLRVERKDAQRGDMRDTYADTTRARAELAFISTVTLEEGLRAQYDWMTAAHD